MQSKQIANYHHVLYIELHHKTLIDNRSNVQYSKLSIDSNGPSHFFSVVQLGHLGKVFSRTTSPKKVQNQIS